MIVSLKNINYKHIIYSRKQQNTITYYNIQYATPNYQVNNIYFFLDMCYSTRKVNNSYFINYELSELKNKKVIEKFTTIERNILKMFNINKNAVYKLKSQFEKEFFNAFELKNSKKKLLLKITGIWENEHEYGLIYRFYV
jgi:hypothetical protein